MAFRQMYAPGVSSPRDLAALSAEDFKRVVGTDFHLVAEGEELAQPSRPLSLRLIDVVGYGSGGAGREPFGVLFRGPHQPVLAHIVHRLVHETMGELEIFLGPIASTEDGISYEAVFA